jgi:hypothetical protein
MTSEKHIGVTPSGGDYTEIFYFDEKGNAAEKSVAKRAIVRECKSDGTLVNETFAYFQ